MSSVYFRLKPSDTQNWLSLNARVKLPVPTNFGGRDQRPVVERHPDHLDRTDRT